jgi:hypothetical protein
MFAESTPQEWLKKAKDFMKLDLYELAAKCYRQGKEPYMERVALSHQRALGQFEKSNFVQFCRKIFYNQ